MNWKYVRKILSISVCFVVVNLVIFGGFRGQLLVAGPEFPSADVNQLNQMVDQVMTLRKPSRNIFNKGKPPDQNPSEHMFTVSDTYIDMKIWIDVPNDFPWRKCILDYNGIAATGECIIEQGSSNWAVPLFGTELKIKTQNRERCLEPPNANDHPDSVKNLYILVKKCTEGTWSYTGHGQLEWSGGGCLSSTGMSGGNHIILTECNRQLADQRFEFGLVKQDEEGKLMLGPVDYFNWLERQEHLREDDVEDASDEVRAALLWDEFKDVQTVERRAVVFYLDRGSGFLSYLRWWILAWKLLGLNSEEEKFDIVLFVHPESIKHIPDDCQLYDESKNLLSGRGKCIYQPLIGIAYRDHRFDPYINSHECLVSENSTFLARYSHLLRSDMDTFPTPAMVGFWPKSVVANKYQGYAFRNASGVSGITEALKDAASHVGIQHKGWHDIGSTWFGPGHRILKLSKLTVALSRFLNPYLFGPGTICKCATCTRLPKWCEWAGGGPYAGTLLLYAQEIAMNSVWTEEEYKNMSIGYVDHGTTSSESVCSMIQLHVFHNAERFSKFSFGMGQYKNFNMSELDVSKVVDYATYLALKSANQGVDAKVPEEKFSIGGEGSLAKLCKDDKIPSI